MDVGQTLQTVYFYIEKRIVQPKLNDTLLCCIIVFYAVGWYPHNTAKCLLDT